MSVSSSEINILIQRYFQELGYDHSAFAFGSESQISHSKVAERKVPPGSLIYLIQKGIMFSQIDSAAQEAVGQPEELFGHELNYLRANLRQSVDIADEVSKSTRRMKVFHTDKSEIQPNILSYQSSLVLQGHTAPVTLSKWSVNGDYLASGSCDGSVVIWSFNNIKSKDSYVTDQTFYVIPEDDKEKMCDITALAWSDSNILAVGVYSGLVVLIKDGEIIGRMREHPAPVTSLCWHNDRLISGSINGTLVISQDCSVLRQVNLDGGDLTDVSWFEETKEAEEGKEPETQSIAIASCGSNVFSIQVSEELPKILFQAKTPIAMMSLDKNHQNIVVGDDSGNVSLLLKDGTRKTDEIQKAPITSIAWCYQPKTYVCCAEDGTIKLVHLDGNQPVSFLAHKTSPYALAVDPLGRYFSTAAADGNLCIWDLANNRMIAAYIAAPDFITHLQWSPTGRFMSISLDSGAVSVLDFDQLC